VLAANDETASTAASAYLEDSIGPSLLADRRKRDR
jgi:hypothetical protein